VIVASASRALAHALESGHFDGHLAGLASRAWARMAAQHLVRKIAVADHVRVIAVGGTTLGGSGKTPVAIAWAHAEAKKRGSVAFIGHAYRARPQRARVVSISDDVADVGDEALVAARALSNVADVVVAPTRQMAVDFAIARGARVLVLDGVAQIAPRRADVALLVTGSDHSNACPPAGDLRAPISILRDLADFVVVVSDDEHPSLARNEIAVRSVSSGARAANGDVISFAELSKLRVGLALAIAHPERVHRMLIGRGVVPVARSYVGDHMGAHLRGVMARVSRRDRAIDAWLITEKCAANAGLTSHDTIPIYVVGHRIELPAGVAS
jgi:tetraacyldisaccharide 4'-kinase